MSSGSATALVGGENIKVPPLEILHGGIVFSQPVEGGGSEIFVMNEEGEDVRQLTDSASIDRHPSQSPDGMQIAFSSDRAGDRNDGMFKIFIMNFDGTNVRQITRNSNDANPAWSPDGTQIAFSRGRDDSPQIFIVNVDGTNVRQVTNSDGFAHIEPSWSPDGQKIVFSGSPPNGQFEIYTVNTEGTDLRQISYNDRPSSSPSWSPDGTQIIFSAFLLIEDLSFSAHIFIMDSDGTDTRKLTDNEMFSSLDTEPAWSPDGTEVVFSRAPTGESTQFEIYIINANGTDLRRFWQEGRDPSWK